LPIRDGWNLLDDNILACSEAHIREVFAMLKRQDRRAEFTGGLEAARLQDWHIDLLVDLSPEQMFFAYDTPDDYEPLVDAGRRLQAAGFTRASHALRAYVLIGTRGDRLEAAEARLKATWDAGFFPMAMLMMGKGIIQSDDWRRLRREWCNPYVLGSRLNAAAKV
jgi:hypothetical protein